MALSMCGKLQRDRFQTFLILSLALSLNVGGNLRCLSFWCWSIGHLEVQ